jgi:hypothetical protein
MRDHLRQEKTGNLPSSLPEIDRHRDFGLIEYEYAVAGMAAPSRSHIESRLVRAVRDLLVELDINCTPDQVAKVLHAEALRGRSEKIHPD